MTASRLDLIQAREDVLKAALDVLRAERELSDDGPSALAVSEADERLALAAKRLTEVVGESGARRPKGWDS